MSSIWLSVYIICTHCLLLQHGLTVGNWWPTIFKLTCSSLWNSAIIFITTFYLYYTSHRSFLLQHKFLPEILVPKQIMGRPNAGLSELRNTQMFHSSTEQCQDLSSTNHLRIFTENLTLLCYKGNCPCPVITIKLKCEPTK